MLEFLDELENVPATLVLWAIGAYVFLWLPGQMGYGSYTLMFKLSGSLALLPITYIILIYMGNK